MWHWSTLGMLPGIECGYGMWLVLLTMCEFDWQSQLGDPMLFMSWDSYDIGGSINQWWIILGSSILIQ